MSGMVRDILEKHPRTDGQELLFSASNGSQFSAWSKAKRDLDEKLKGTIVKPWTTHDLRRTFATRAGDLGVRPHIVETILNHVSGHRSGIAGTYNHSLYPAETAQAMNLWADHVAAVLADRKSKVASLRQPAASEREVAISCAAFRFVYRRLVRALQAAKPRQRRIGRIG